MLGVEPGESSRRCRPVFPINHQRRCAAHGVEDLLLVAAGLIVLGDLLAGWDVDEVHAERAQAERPTHEPPGAARLAVVAVGEIEAHRSPFLSVGTGRVSGTARHQPRYRTPATGERTKPLVSGFVVVELVS